MDDDPQMWHVSVLLFPDDRERLTRLVNTYNAERMIRGERMLTAHEYLSTRIRQWIEAEANQPREAP